MMGGGGLWVIDMVRPEREGWLGMGGGGANEVQISCVIFAGS